MLVHVCSWAYNQRMIKRTSLNLDLDLLAAAKDVLQTRETTETIHRALEDVVQNARLRRLVARRFDLSNDELAALRTPEIESVTQASVSRD
jgi:Arc/MetJ family transcription regulator